ncbi:dUTP diphosphatase [Synchytrium microbalum]|uniref:Deoxyuridine 5'-triphosphate nucleotidohydrolase n=1 Tax=Synchytrium microbalum TaxID=1806994 RepID=A0A507C004_9FUNG|nr:dUTP diphosphatase [Synchytrium microbalum]TPX34387.1 dUTP diphosphatase [Synchytrium microbalum]
MLATASEPATTIPSTKRQKMDEPIPLLVKKVGSKAQLPTRGSDKAAGWDLYSSADVVIPAKGKVIVPTDIQIALPPGTYGRVAPRSGLAVKHFLDVGAGVIDEDYRGNVGVVMFNFSDVDFEVKTGDRIAQLILERIYHTTVLEVEDLSLTIRGAGGFGSTGFSTN